MDIKINKFSSGTTLKTKGLHYAWTMPDYGEAEYRVSIDITLGECNPIFARDSAWYTAVPKENKLLLLLEDVQ